MTDPLARTAVRILALFPMAGLAAQNGRQDARAEVFGLAYRIDDFENGLRLITVPTDQPGIVAVHVIVSVGSRHEVEEGKSGFAHFFEHMMFRGTKTLTSEQQAALFKRAGADRNAYTTDDYTNYHTTVARDELENVLRLEADRFQNLEYSEKAFRTEAMAVLGEYNKGSSNPISRLLEALQDTAFDHHTYEHTTIGFLRDIRAMPRQFEYSRRFFDRFYRPEYTTILVVGDTTRDETRALVERDWAGWKRGDHVVSIPVEPEQREPRTCHVDWPAPTQPWIAVAFRGPAFSTQPDAAALDLIASTAFSSSSPLYEKLFVRERRVDVLMPYFADHTDPFLVIVLARLRDSADWASVRDEIVATFDALTRDTVDPVRLADVKANLRYSFAAQLDSAPGIASALAGHIARSRTPAVVDSVFRTYDEITPDVIRSVARRYFVASSRTIATLADQPLTDPEHGVEPAASGVSLPSALPLVSLRLVVPVGAASDPPGKQGLAYVTSRMLVEGGTRHRTYERILGELYPLAASVDAQVDKEITVLHGTVHRDNLEAYYGLLREMLREPGFRSEDLERIRANTISQLDTGLRRSDDEELGKEVLLGEMYVGHPYRHPNAGTLEGLASITIEDVRAFHAAHYGAVVPGLAGGYPAGFPARVAAELGAVAVDDAATGGVLRPVERPQPARIERNRMTIVTKHALATGIHIGFPIDVTRSHPDWCALWLVRSFLGEHRSENSHLYQRLREVRGLNYGDYAYIEYFPNGGSHMQPQPNYARALQAFSIWIRPVPHENGPFALKAAWYELDRLVREGLTAEQFTATRDYLSKYAALLVASQDRRLGYAIDGEYYGTGEFVPWVRRGLAALTREDVNRALRAHLRSDRLQFVVVTQDGQSFADAILSDRPTPISYQTPPAADVLAEDAQIERIRIPIARDDIRVVPVESVFVR